MAFFEKLAGFLVPRVFRTYYKVRKHTRARRPKPCVSMPLRNPTLRIMLTQHDAVTLVSE
jgi:hypothetical protein